MTTGSPARRVIGVPLGISRAATSRETVVSLRICMMSSSGSAALGGRALRLRRDRRVLAGERRLQRVPGQRRALDTHGVLAHAREDRELAERGIVALALAGDEVVEALEQRVGLGLR